MAEFSPYPIQESALRRVAVVIGVNTAPNSLLPTLHHAVTNAQAMAEALQQHCHFDLLVPPLLDEQAISANVKRVLLQLARNRTEDDFLLLYFSGYSQSMRVDGRENVYLVTHDFEEVEVQEDEHAHLSLGWLRQKFYGASEAGRVLVILDCCSPREKTLLDYSLQDLQAQIAYYCAAPDREGEVRGGRFRLALVAVGDEAQPAEDGEYSLMTGLLLPALRGEVEEVMDQQGQIKLQLLHSYLETAMAHEQLPSLVGDFAGRSCVLALYAERQVSTAPLSNDKESQGDHKGQPPRATPPSPLSNDDVSESPFLPVDVTPFRVEALSEEDALRSLLETTRPALLREVLAQGGSAEANAARSLCQLVGYLPLALAHLRGLLARDREMTLVRLTELVRTHSNMDMAKLPTEEMAPLFSTFVLSWQQVSDIGVQRLFKLAGYFPEVTSIPLWLLGLAAGLGESGETWEPLGEARRELQELSFVEGLRQEQIRLHPLMQAFARWLLLEDPEQGQAFIREAGERLCAEVENLEKLQARARREGYWGCLEQVRLMHAYAVQLGMTYAGRLERVERWLDREGYLLGNGELWANRLPDLFYQQIYNRSVEEGRPLDKGTAPARWLRLLAPVGAEDQALLRIFPGHEHQVKGVAFSPDSSKVLTSSRDRKARLWEAATGKLLMTFTHQDSEVLSVAFSPDGNRILTGCYDHQAQIWDVNSGKRLMYFVHQKPVNCVAFSPDGTKVLIGCSDSAAHLWDANSGEHLIEFEGHQNEVVDRVAFSPDGKQVLTGSWDHTARLWDARTGKQLMLFEGYSTECLAFSPNGRQILLACEGHGVRMWDITTRKPLMTFSGHLYYVASVAFSPDGKLVLTGSQDHTARLWDATTGECLATFAGHTEGAMSVAFSPDGTQVLTGSDDHTARLWKVSKAKPLIPIPGHQRLIECIAFSANERQMLTGAGDNTARLWEVESGKLLRTFQGQHWVIRVALSADGTRALAGESSGIAELWDVTSGQLVATLSHRSHVQSLTFSADGKQILTGSHLDPARLWDATNGKLLRTFGDVEQHAQDVAFSPDGRRVLTGSTSGTAQLWEISSGKPVLNLEDGAQRVEHVAFSPDGRRVLTGSWIDPVRVWDAANGRLLIRLEGERWRLDKVPRNIVFSPDSRLVLVFYEGGQTWVWDCAGSQPKLVGVYATTYPVGAIYWIGKDRALLADLGGPRFYPHFYRLKLEGMRTKGQGDHKGQPPYTTLPSPLSNHDGWDRDGC